MALSPTPATTLGRHLAITLLLLALFGVVAADLQHDSLWFDEGYSLYVIRDTGAPPDGVVETARLVWNSAKDTIARARADVHPPLYFLALDVWSLLAGESVLAVRLLSAWFGLFGVAATYALGRRLFDHRAGLLAAGVLGTASMMVYYSRETRMYTLLLALAVLAMLAYWRWRARPTPARTVIYAGLIAALLYTHYAAFFILLTQLVHLVLTRPRRAWRVLIPAGLALLLYVPWLPGLWWQFTTYGGPAAAPFTDSATAIAALIFFTSGGYWGLYVAPIALNLVRSRHARSELNLLALWLLLTPVALLLLNTAIPSIFQVRYAIGALPAGALLVAGGLTARPNGGDRGDKWHRPYLVVSGLLLAAMVYTQLTVYPFVWLPKPPWEATIRRMVETRQPLEPALTIIPAQSPVAYYDRLLGIRRGLTLDLAWRWQESYAMTGYIDPLRDAESVWIAMPGTFASTWDAARELLADRHVGYRDDVMAMVFYRFDQGTGGPLRFRFGDLLAYDGGIQHRLFARTGEDFCFQLELTALADLADDYAIDFYLTQGYDTIRAITTLEPVALDSGQTLALAPCLSLAADNPAGPHHLRVRVYNPVNNQPAPVIEGEAVYWGAEVIFALVSVA